MSEEKVEMVTTLLTEKTAGAIYKHLEYDTTFYSYVNAMQHIGFKLKFYAIGPIVVEDVQSVDYIAVVIDDQIFDEFVGKIEKHNAPGYSFEIIFDKNGKPAKACLGPDWCNPQCDADEELEKTTATHVYNVGPVGNDSPFSTFRIIRKLRD